MRSQTTRELLLLTCTHTYHILSAISRISIFPQPVFLHNIITATGNAMAGDGGGLRQRLERLERVDLGETAGGEEYGAG